MFDIFLLFGAELLTALALLRVCINVFPYRYHHSRALGISLFGVYYCCSGVYEDVDWIIACSSACTITVNVLPLIPGE